MTDADTGLAERDEQVTIVSINRLRCGNAVEGFARSKALQGRRLGKKACPASCVRAPGGPPRHRLYKNVVLSRCNRLPLESVAGVNARVVSQSVNPGPQLRLRAALKDVLGGSAASV